MPGGRASTLRWVFPALFALYTAGLVGWLALGLLPTLVADLPAVRDAVGSLTTAPGVVGRVAARVLHPGMVEPVTSGGQTCVQYGFSLLNLGFGLLLITRRPRELVPRLLGVALLGTAATFNMPSHRAFHLLADPWPVALGHFTFHIVSGVAYLWAVVLFPDGTLPRRPTMSRSRLVGAAVAVTGVAAVVCWRSSFLAHPQFFVVFFGIVVSVAGVAAQLLRLSDPRTTPAQRRAARLLCGAVLPAFMVATSWLVARGLAWTGPRAGQVAGDLQDAFPVAFALVPVVLAATIARLRLWDVDRLLSRVLGYGLLAAAAAVAEPARLRAHRWINRVVFGQLLSPTEAVRTLIGGLDRLGPAGELDQLVTVAHTSTRAAAVSLWLITDGRLVRAAAHPALPGPAERPLPDADDPVALARAVTATYAVPVHDAGALAAVLAITMPPGVELRRREHQLLSDLAGHAGLLVHNALLTVALARQVGALTDQAAQLRRSRRELVTAQDTARRALERDLHDGAQQSLVAAIIGIRTAADPAAVAPLTQLLLETRYAIRQLAGGAVPRVLTERGLPAAISDAAELARRAGLQVATRVQVPDDLPEQTGIAVYFCCLEALQNVVKHARATRVQVDVEVDGAADGQLRFAVSDDGTGIGPGTDPAGGLQNLADRVAAIGGALSIESTPGRGTRMVGRLPLPDRAVALR